MFLTDAMLYSPNLTWSTELDGVDISNQTVETQDTFIQSSLNIRNTLPRYCGTYTCSAIDVNSAGPVNDTTTVDVGKKGIYLLSVQKI